MTDTQDSSDLEGEALQAYTDRCLEAWAELFEAARSKEEVQFAMALNPEFRGMQDAGWSTAEESSRALQEYVELLHEMEPGPIKIRVALSLYSHLSEASGLYEVPKNMMRIASGDDYVLWPFKHLVARHTTSGAMIAPNANKVMKDLLGHANELHLEKLKSAVVEAFDPDIRNGYAHADYIIWNDTIRLRKRNGGYPSTVPLIDFTIRLNKAIVFFQTLRNKMADSVRSYSTRKRVIGRMNSREPAMPTVIHYDEATGSFSISSGFEL